MVRTLIVDDNACFRQSLKEVLHKRFPLVDVEEAADREETWQKIKLVRPNVVFMDIRLPGENGLELTREIKAVYPKIVFVIITCCDSPEYRQAAGRYGANHFISKNSSTSEELLALIESILSDLRMDSEGMNGRGA